MIQGADAFADEPVALACLGPLLWIRRRDAQANHFSALVIIGHHAIAASPPEMVVAEVGGDLKQPGLEGGLSKRADLLPGAEKRLLRDVGRILPAADHP